ncbi:hypothetical protein ABGB17_03740 [Sphaerisporangium sp. B11E5]|uniref:hypothetical protein n=1 Tax=Sphaerisporangium sp. B11E5 TaxID=3153563 RepID=UPI00325E998E
MSNQDPGDTGVWRPPASELSWFAPAPRLARPDVRVWPPTPPDEPRSTSTVPMPAVGRGPAPGSQAPPPRATAPTDWFAPTGAPRQAAPVLPEASQEEPQPAPATRSPARRRRMRTAEKVTLQIFGAVVLTAALFAVWGYDELARYERDSAPQVRHVAPGQDATLLNTRWRLIGLEVMATQPESQAPGTVSMQIEVEGTALNEHGVYYSIGPPGFRLGDDSGRTWMALAWKAPDKLTPGVPGRFKLISSVPEQVADRVELLLWPNENAASREQGQALRFDG